LVSPASSIASSDLDEKSIGSESCDGSIKGTKLVFTGLNSLDKEKITKITTDPTQFQLLEQLIRESKECETMTIKTSQRTAQISPSTFQPVLSGAVTKLPEPEPVQNMVECSICARKFKNIPALNGHMRLHGGYYRKDNDKNKHAESQRSQSSGSTEMVSTHRVSSNVISLIEEKIIQKRKLEPGAGSAGRRPTLKYQLPLSHLSQLTLASCSTPIPCSTSSPVSEPAAKRLALDSNKLNISALDNLVFPLLPQPDTDSLLAGLASKSASSPRGLSSLLPHAPLPVTPSGLKSDLTSQLKAPHQQKLLKIHRTNFQPSIGDDHQASLPQLRLRPEEWKVCPSHDSDLMWSPCSPHLDTFPHSQFESYLKLASSAAVKDNGNSVESALTILLQCKGSIILATQRLLGFIKQEESSPLPKHWTAEEVDMFYEALCKHKKDFSKISADLPHKTSKDCVEFYYLWKNICREESQSFKSIINDSPDCSDHVLAI